MKKLKRKKRNPEYRVHVGSPVGKERICGSGKFWAWSESADRSTQCNDRGHSGVVIGKPTERSPRAALVNGEHIERIV